MLQLRLTTQQEEEFRTAVERRLRRRAALFGIVGFRPVATLSPPAPGEEDFGRLLTIRASSAHDPGGFGYLGLRMRLPEVRTRNPLGWFSDSGNLNRKRIEEIMFILCMALRDRQRSVNRTAHPLSV